MGYLVVSDIHELHETLKQTAGIMDLKYFFIAIFKNSSFKSLAMIYECKRSIYKLKHDIYK